MKKLVTLLFIIFSFFSCSDNKANKKLVYNLFSAPRTLDPHKLNDNISLQVSHTLYEGLLRLNDKNEIVGGLAKEYIKDGNTYIFKLRENLKYSDGSEIKANDIKNSFIRILDKEYLSQYASSIFVIKNAKNYYDGKVSSDDIGIKIEDNNILIELEKDINYFPYLMTLPISAPYKEGKYNGGFKLITQNENEIILVKNEHYWRSDEVYLDEVKYVYFNDFSTVNNLIKNSEIDISRVDVELLNENINTYVDGRIWYLDFNVFNNEIIKNKNLRKAISYAIDKDKYVEIIKKDGSVKANNLISNIFDYKTKYLVDDFNISKAKEYIKKAKEEIGNDIKIELLSGNTIIESKEIQFIQQQLIQNLEIEVSIKVVPFKERLSLIRENKYDVALNTYSPKYLDPVSILDRFSYKSKETNIYDQTLYRDNLEKARVISSNRLDIIHNLEKTLLENYVIYPLYFSIENQYINSNIKNIVNHPIGNITNLTYIK